MLARSWLALSLIRAWVKERAGLLKSLVHRKRFRLIHQFAQVVVKADVAAEIGKV